MFAYCGNNPATTEDPSGHIMRNTNLMMTDGPGAHNYLHRSSIVFTSSGIDYNYGDFTRTVISEVVSFVTNDDAEVCQNSTFSFYKCVPVFNIKSNLLDKLDITSFSFGAIFMINPRQNTFETDLNHERGHSTQFLLLGPARYTLKVAAPSLLYNCVDRFLPSDNYHYYLYYSLPLERGADFFGKVDRENYIFDKNGVLSLFYLLLP